MKRRFFSGNTVEQALVLASSTFQVAPERLAYAVVEKRHGFVKTPRRVVIEVDPDRPERAPGAAPPAISPPREGEPRRSPAPPPSRPPSPHPGPHRPPPERNPTPGRRPAGVPVLWQGEPEGAPAAESSLEAKASRALGRLLRLAGLDLRAEIRMTSDGLAVDLVGPDRLRLLEDEAELLAALEYLLPRTLVGALPEGMSCRVDSEGFRREREDALRELARKTADGVRASGVPALLEAMNPAERRIIHVALKEDPEVTTESEGDGFFKQVMIKRR